MFKLTLDYYDLSVLTTHLLAMSHGHNKEVVELSYVPPNIFRMRIINEAIEIEAYGYWPEKIYAPLSVIGLMKRSLRIISSEKDILYKDNKVYVGPLSTKAYTLVNASRCEEEPLACLVRIQTNFNS